MLSSRILSRIRLLIVDDDPLLAEFLRDGLQQQFSLIMVVAGVDQAKSLMDGPFVFHAIICDYQLRDGTGLDLYRWLRRHRRDPMPFLMISGKIDALEMDDPAFAFLAKPFASAAVLDLLRQMPIQLEPAEVAAG